MENKMKNKKSSIMKDAFALFLITLISGLALGFVYETTKAPIEEKQMMAKLEAYQVVYQGAASITEDEKLMEAAAVADLKSIHASYVGVTVDEVNAVYDSNDNQIGYILKITTNQGYKDPITMAIGYALDGTVKGIETLSINETAGLGMKAAEASFKNQFADKKVDQFETTKTGATQDNQINAISSATITTDAIVHAVNAGIGFLQEYSTELGGGTNE